MDLYRAALDRLGKPFPAELPMMREICVADSREAALALARPSLEKKYQAYVNWGQHRALPGDDDMTQAFDNLLRDRFILGDPHPIAYLRVLLGVQMCIRFFGAGPWDDLGRAWIRVYPTSSATPEVTSICASAALRSGKVESITGRT